MTNAGVFSINFARQEILPPSVKRCLAYLVLGYLAVNVFAAVFFMAVTFRMYQEQRQLALDLQSTALSPKAIADLRHEWKSLKKEVSSHLVRLNSAIAIEKERFGLAEKLAGLSRTLPPRTWIAALGGNRSGRTLTVQALYVGKPDEPYKVPGKEWIEALKADPAFGSGLKRIELAQPPQRVQKKAELYSFGLVAEWAQT